MDTNSTQAVIKKVSGDPFILDSLTLTLGDINTPTFNSALYEASQIRTYSPNGFLIDEDTETIRFSTQCAFPCRSCLPEN